MAILVELFFRSVLDLEDPSDSGYLPLASTDYTGDRGWVGEPFPDSHTPADSARLPGTPIWLASVYSMNFGPVNKYWLPAMWWVDL